MKTGRWFRHTILRRPEPGFVRISRKAYIDLLVAERYVNELEAESARLDAERRKLEAEAQARAVISEVRIAHPVCAAAEEDLLFAELPVGEDGTLYDEAFRLLVIEHAALCELIDQHR